jgi:hypothetical protein
VAYGTTELVNFDASGHLGAPWNTEGITPPALRTDEGISEQWADVTGLPDGRRLLTNALFGPSTNTSSISLPGVWTTTIVSPYSTPLRVEATLACADRGHVLVGGTAADSSDRSHALVAAYSLVTGALDKSFGKAGYIDVPFTHGEPTADEVRALAASGSNCTRFFTLAARYSDDGGYQINRFWGPARH